MSNETAPVVEAPVAETKTETNGEQSPKGTVAKKSSPRASKSKTNTPKPSVMRVTLKQANAAAVKSGDATEGEALFLVPLSRITVNDNPRHEPARLHEYDYVLTGDPVEYEPEEGETEGETRYCLRDMALSEDMDMVREFVELIECYESPINRLISPTGTVDFVGTEYECKERLNEKAEKKGWKIEPHPAAPQSITELAADLLQYDSDGNGTNLVPALANPIGQSGNWNLIDGGRRATAVLYNHAKSRVQIANKEEGAPNHPYPAIIKVEDRPVKKGEQTNIAILLNQSRKEMNEWQLGKVYYDFCQTSRLVNTKDETLDFIGTTEECEAQIGRASCRERV